MQAYIGTAGWSVAARYGHAFPGLGSHLARYGQGLKAAEINSSFHRPHQHKTYLRWAASVPRDFRFSVKLPRQISHDLRLKDFGAPLDRFLEEVGGLGDKLAVLLVQLPPSLAYEVGVAGAFFRALRKKGQTAIACEPRHASWFTPAADRALQRLQVARVAADPPRTPEGGEPGGWRGLRYWRLHGSPRIYYSDYSQESLAALAAKLQPGDWCIFDNTAGSAALGNALSLKTLTSA